MSTPKGSFLFVAFPPEGQEQSLVYQNLKSKVVNAGNPFGEISSFPIPQFKVRSNFNPDFMLMMTYIDRDLGHLGRVE